MLGECFVWRCDKRSFKGKLGEDVTFSETELAEVLSTGKGAFVVVNGDISILPMFAGEGRYSVEVRIRERDGKVGLRLLGMVPVDSAMASTAAAQVAAAVAADPIKAASDAVAAALPPVRSAGKA